MTDSEDADLLEQIRELVDRQHRIRAALGDHTAQPADKSDELADIQSRLDQLWDLVRQRMAAREFSRDPAVAQPRSQATVRAYLT